LTKAQQHLSNPTLKFPDLETEYWAAPDTNKVRKENPPNWHTHMKTSADAHTCTQHKTNPKPTLHESYDYLFTIFCTTEIGKSSQQVPQPSFVQNTKTKRCATKGTNQTTETKVYDSHQAENYIH